MKSVILFFSLLAGMLATLLMGFLVGASTTLIIYLIGSNLRLSFEIKRVRAAQQTQQRLKEAERDPTINRLPPPSFPKASTMPSTDNSNTKV